MKKIFNKTIVVILSVMMCCIFALGIGYKTDWRGFIAKAEDYTKDYKSLSYEELDDITHRSAKSVMPAQITVFTHGLGGSGKHWTNRSWRNEENKTVSEFDYDDASMIEQLREKIELSGREAVVMTAKMNIEMRLNAVTLKGAEQEYVSELSLEEARSQVVPFEEKGTGDDGADSLRKLYKNFSPERTVNTTTGIIVEGPTILLSKQDKYSYGTSSAVENITESDTSKHIILIFEAVSPNDSNDYVYAQLEYILDVISYQYLQLNNILPTYNLVGFSRGGITNMQYALAHPYNVSTIYSMGAPYNGSAFGSATWFDGNHPFLSVAGYSVKDVLYSYDVDYYTLDTVKDLGDAVELNYTPGVIDILTPELSNSYRSYWNENYDYFEHIDFRPVGTYVTFGYVLQTLIDFIECEYDWNDDLISFLSGVAIGVETVGGADSILVPRYAKTRIINSSIDLIKDAIKAIFDIEIRNAWFQIFDNFRTIPVLYSHIGVSYTPTFVIADDLFIDLNSQIAYGYTGAEVKVRLMDSIDQIEGRTKKSVPGSAGVGHNLEPRNKDIVEYITNTISGELIEQEMPFDYRYTPNGYYITNMNIDISNAGVLTIPSSFDGMPIIGIDRLCRDIIIDSDNSYNSSITKIVLPSTIQYISDYAFFGMDNLESIDFNGAKISKIAQAAFMNCGKLKEISLPATLESIGGCVFANCLALESIIITSKINDVGATAFVGCSKLSSITVDAANPYYSSANGILFNKAGTELLYYPEGKTGTSYTVPTSVTEIAPFAFYSNSKLETLNLNNVGMIRQYALSGCENLAIIQASNLNYVEIGAFDGTKWLENQTSDIVALGNVLVLYQGSASELSIEDVTSIAPMAFANNETLEMVTLNNGLVNIGDGAFYGCSNLETVYICNKSAMIFVSNASFDVNAEGRVIYVPYNLQGEYKDNELWKQYEDSIEVHQTNITYVLNGGTCDVTSGAVYYQDDLDLPTPCKNGNTFKGWYDNAALTGNKLDEQTMWDSLAENVTFYAKWEENTYKALLHPKGGAVTPTEIEYKISDGSKTLPEPSRVGYTFEGWYVSEDYSGTAVTAIPAGTYEDKNYYAKWKSIEYMVQLSPNYPGASNWSEHVAYGKREYITVPNRTGYNFLGWAYNGELYTDEKGLLNEPWAFTEQVTLVAQWQAKESTIIITIGGITYEYSIFYDEMIQLQVPTKVGYTFQGWRDETGKLYTDNSGMMTIPWDKEDETVELSASWRLNTYIVVYNQNGGYGTMSSSIHTYSVYKNLSTNSFYKTGHDFIGWATSSTGNAVYSNGESVVDLSVIDGGIVTLYAVWKSKIYNIIYKNLMPEMSVYPSTYTYGEGLQTMPTIYLISGYYSTPLENFYGWYTSANFATRVYSISATQTGDVTLYAKYDYWISSTYASYTNTVTDDGIDKQPSFGVDVFLDSIYFDMVKNTTLDKIKIIISFDMWEVNDGYQDLYLYNGDTKIWSQTINRGSGKDTSAKNYTFTIELDIYEYQNVDFMDLKFSAHGNFSDTWKFNNFEMSIYFTN